MTREPLPVQIAMYLPPPITAHEAAAVLGRFGGQARARQLRAPIIATARELRRELGLPPLAVLERRA